MSQGLIHRRAGEQWHIGGSLQILRLGFGPTGQRSTSGHFFQIGTMESGKGDWKIEGVNQS